MFYLRNLAIFLLLAFIPNPAFSFTFEDKESYSGLNYRVRIKVDPFSDKQSCTLFFNGWWTPGFNNGFTYIGIFKDSVRIFPLDDHDFYPNRQGQMRFGDEAPFVLKYKSSEGGVLAPHIGRDQFVQAMGRNLDYVMRFVEWPSQRTKDVEGEIVLFNRVYNAVASRCSWPLRLPEPDKGDIKLEVKKNTHIANYTDEYFVEGSRHLILRIETGPYRSGCGIYINDGRRYPYPGPFLEMRGGELFLGDGEVELFDSHLKPIGSWNEATGEDAEIAMSKILEQGPKGFLEFRVNTSMLLGIRRLYEKGIAVCGFPRLDMFKDYRSNTTGSDEPGQYESENNLSPHNLLRYRGSAPSE